MPMRRSIAAAWLLLVAVLALSVPHFGTTRAEAGSVEIAELGQDRIRVEIVDTSIDEVVDRLARAYGFLVERIGDTEPREAVSGSFQGSLKSILERVLRTENHIIQTSSRAASGIARVSLYSGAGNTDGARAVQPPAAGEDGPRPLPRTGVPAARPRPTAAQAYAIAQPAPRASTPATVAGAPVVAATGRSRRGGIVD